MRILILDNDRDLVEMLTSWLRTLGYEVFPASTGERARAVWVNQQPDLVLLDPAFKEGDALAMCHDMRVKHDALIVVMADAQGVHDEVRCLEAGADDYLRKPFFPSQLLAHLHAVTRRARSTLQQRPSSTVTVGPICVDSLRNEVRIHGRVERLTPTESKLLYLLALNAGAVCTASQIVTYVWGYEGEGNACLIKAHIRHLRQKIEPDPGNPRYILTVPGAGYSLARIESGLLKKGA